MGICRGEVGGGGRRGRSQGRSENLDFCLLKNVDPIANATIPAAVKLSSCRGSGARAWTTPSATVRADGVYMAGGRSYK